MWTRAPHAGEAPTFPAPGPAPCPLRALGDPCVSCVSSVSVEGSQRQVPGCSGMKTGDENAHHLRAEGGAGRGPTGVVAAHTLLPAARAPALGGAPVHKAAIAKRRRLGDFSRTYCSTVCRPEVQRAGSFSGLRERITPGPSPRLADGCLLPASLPIVFPCCEPVSKFPLCIRTPVTLEKGHPPPVWPHSNNYTCEDPVSK